MLAERERAPAQVRKQYWRNVEVVADDVALAQAQRRPPELVGMPDADAAPAASNLEPGLWVAQAGAPARCFSRR
jgi:hypothetical protein